MFIVIPWHEEPYLERTDCWGCGLEADTSGPRTWHPGFPGDPPESIPLCTYCADLTTLIRAQERARGHIMAGPRN